MTMHQPCPRKPTKADRGAPARVADEARYTNADARDDAYDAATEAAAWLARIAKDHH